MKIKIGSIPMSRPADSKKLAAFNTLVHI